ncbi:tRNA/rRNA methyltransferase (SpoU) [Deinococcus proteolyticus MRP]|uniref:tRNA/rRNA methyltransferase (SpoU) n=1 Tax=Deinococcus proteolyticus (strain ATCC 35074 / DSM 20540 / JCM 6276 / NBRC 101906 / NCIMB 13154 / VKM Ac-1939 / CCM 2703 / MRP) TaxID=693977 RepID=F0RMY4_DEIPM|nr:RNA methyltransferase [Deinococcus proteolyticus]ADY26126.1 tRNA/rRNA methyltransferase (SpoU) [Deinococcus proteolyticus MRP]
MPSPITSLQNPTVKRLVRLRSSRRLREGEGTVLIEGARETARALAAGWAAGELYLCPALFSPEAAELAPQLPMSAVTELSAEAFAKVSGRENPDGVLLLSRPPQERWPTLPPQALLVVLHGLEKPGNVGAILRTVDGVGADGVLILGRGADPYSPNVIRASQGSVFTVPLRQQDEAEALAWLEEEGFTLVACTPDAPRTFWQADLTGRVALLLGTEHEGLPEHWRRHESAVSIPMRGQADSLNVATAAAVVLYEALRQRQ